MGIRCPHCKSRLSLVIDTGRQDHDDGFILRRRQCKMCRRRFNTHERVVVPNKVKEIDLVRLRQKLTRISKTVDDIQRVLKKKRD